jgi:hypothetical protein
MQYYLLWRSCCYPSDLWIQQLPSWGWIKFLAVVKLITR